MKSAVFLFLLRDARSKIGSLQKKLHIVFFFLFLALFLVVSGGALAEELSAKNSFERINGCVQKNDSQSCQDLVTASSASLYSRFMSYGLMNCLPKDAKYVSQQWVDGGVIVRASATDMGKQRVMRLVFVDEEGEWKLDTPESLRMAMGKNWQQQIDLAEQLYLLMKKQFGGKLDCQTIRNLVPVKE